MILILGAGLAGLSCSYHIGHDRCRVLEKGPRPFGHVASLVRDGFTWDQGPHVSFTRNPYVRALFADAVDGQYEEYSVKIGNYFHGHWIDHPAQTALHQVPEPLRAQCLESFISTRQNQGASFRTPTDYLTWLDAAFGPAFARTFPAVYTRKYWTIDPSQLTTEWLGERVKWPSVQDVIDGSRAPLANPRHYIDRVRYPRTGGYQAYARKLAAGCNLRCGEAAVRVDLTRREVHLSSGERLPYIGLINTIPLPEFLRLCADVPASVREAADALSCSQLTLVEVCAPHPGQRPENWIYVYDSEKLSTRLNFTEKLAPGNAPAGWTGVQAEVYSSRHAPLPIPESEVPGKVLDELIEMGVVRPEVRADGTARVQVRHLPWANVIFHRQTRPALERIWSWLEGFGLEREPAETSPLTNWPDPWDTPSPTAAGIPLFMAGRYAQWKYFWSDDCILRGREIASRLGVPPPNWFPAAQRRTPLQGNP